MTFCPKYNLHLSVMNRNENEENVRSSWYRFEHVRCVSCSKILASFMFIISTLVKNQSPCRFLPVKLFHTLQEINTKLQIMTNPSNMMLNRQSTKKYKKLHVDLKESLTLVYVSYNTTWKFFKLEFLILQIDDIRKSKGSYVPSQEHLQWLHHW
jgi:hypothetical protein